jgi:hypothetical protein
MIGCAQLSLRLGKLGRVDEHGRVQPDDMDRLDTLENEGYRVLDAVCENVGVGLGAGRYVLWERGIGKYARQRDGRW